MQVLFVYTQDGHYKRGHCTINDRSGEFILPGMIKAKDNSAQIL